MVQSAFKSVIQKKSADAPHFFFNKKILQLRPAMLNRASSRCHNARFP